MEKVERLLNLWKEKTKDYERIYREGVNAVNDVNMLSQRQKELKLSNLEYAILLKLEGKFGRSNDFVEEVLNLSNKLARHTFPGWFNQTTVKKDVEREVRRFVRGFKAEHKLSIDEMNDLYEKLIESVKNYGDPKYNVRSGNGHYTE
jgi:type I restriction enzyme R subunit